MKTIIAIAMVAAFAAPTFAAEEVAVVPLSGAQSEEEISKYLLEDGHVLIAAKEVRDALNYLISEGRTCSSANDECMKELRQLLNAKFIVVCTPGEVALIDDDVRLAEIKEAGTVPALEELLHAQLPASYVWGGVGVGIGTALIVGGGVAFGIAFGVNPRAIKTTADADGHRQAQTIQGVGVGLIIGGAVVAAASSVLLFGEDAQL